MDQITPADVVKKYIELRDYCDREDDAHTARMKPAREAMVTLENYGLALLNSTGGQNFACDAGTMFKKTITSLKVSDRDKLFDFVAEQNAWDMLTAGVSKDAVKAYMTDKEKNPLGSAPPGVEPTYITKVEFRRA